MADFTQPKIDVPPPRNEKLAIKQKIFIADFA